MATNSTATFFDCQNRQNIITDIFMETSSPGLEADELSIKYID